MMLKLTALLAAACLLVGCADDGSNDEPANAPAQATARADAGGTGGYARVSFELADVEGRLRTSSEWDGKPKLLNFWATWCAPCRREIPLLKEAQDKHAGLDLQVIGIAVDVREDVARYAEEAEFNYPVLVGQEDAMAVAESSGIEFIGLPFTMVLAPSGELIKTHIGEILEEHIDEITAVFADMQRGVIDVAGARERLQPL